MQPISLRGLSQRPNIGEEKHFVLRVTKAWCDPPEETPIYALSLVFVTEHPEEIDVLLAKNGGPLHT